MSDPYRIPTLGPARFPSPIHLGCEPGDSLADFTPDDERILADLSLAALKAALARGEEPPALEAAGPRERLFFDPIGLRAGIVTCGGLCPGLNTVIRALVMSLWHGYGVRSILGFRNGFAGLNPEAGPPPMELSPERVRDIHRQGGTILGTSRGPQEPEVMLDTLLRNNIGLCFAVGGDGTFRGLHALAGAARLRGARLALIGIPKTIDNDIPLVDRTFGFETAVSRAAEALAAAYCEAASVRHGVGLVKLMGRSSGFIAAHAALAHRNVNLVLVPEQPFELEGPRGLLAWLAERFERERPTVIVAAEGAGQDLMPATGAADASGNARLTDIGLFLRDSLLKRFPDINLKYIDPSYMLRSAPPVASDSIFCGHLGQAAVHAGMAGKTDLAVGLSHGCFTHIPLPLLTAGRKVIDLESPLWLSVLESTGQPFFLTQTPPKRLARACFTARDGE